MFTNEQSCLISEGSYLYDYTVKCQASLTRPSNYRDLLWQNLTLDHSLMLAGYIHV